jgi:hypothetical protein
MELIMTDADRNAALLDGMLSGNSFSERHQERRVVYVDCFIPPWPQPKATAPEIAPEPPWEKFGLPGWAFSIWCMAIGFLLSLGVCWTIHHG